MARASADREEEGAGDHTPLLLLWSLLRYSLLGLGGDKYTRVWSRRKIHGRSKCGVISMLVVFKGRRLALLGMYSERRSGA